MTELLWQAWLLLAAAFFVGAVLACSLKRRFYYGSFSKKSDIAASGIAHTPAPGEPKVEVAPRSGIEAERFDRAIAGRTASTAAPAPAPAPAAAPAPVAAAKPQPAPASAPAPVAAAAPAVAVAAAAATAPSGDDLTRIRSIDANLKMLLNDAGIRKFAELAALSATDASALADRIGVRGRIDQENWLGQARILASGGETYYSRRIARGEAVPKYSARPAEAAKPAAAIVASSLPLAFASSTGPADDLTRIRSIDAGLQGKLRELGVQRFSELAALTAADVKAINGALNLGGRVDQESWLAQAAVLASGGETYYSRRLARAAAAAAPTPSAAPAPAPAAPAVAVAAPAPAPVAPAAKAPTPAPEVDVPFTPISPRIPPAAAADVAALRSIRSEALLGADVVRPNRAAGETDDLKRIRGIGVLIEKKLNSLGIVHYEQVANWTGADIERISSILDFKGRIERENWIEQARILATGGQTEFSRRNEA